MENQHVNSGCPPFVPDVVPVGIGGSELGYALRASASHSGDRAHGGMNTTSVIAYNIQNNDGGSHKRKDRPDGGMYVNETDVALTVETTDLTAVAAFDERNITSKTNRTKVEIGAPANTQHSGAQSIIGMGVRRLTPRETERLQGFPDDFTAWAGGHTKMSDSARYRMMGNAVSVPVAEWIGRRIMDVAAK